MFCIKKIKGSFGIYVLKSVDFIKIKIKQFIASEIYYNQGFSFLSSWDTSTAGTGRTSQIY